ncbi:hypothetical protein Asulf_00845 [Archaeoglobus sulfaticallidus PM70-1]|uniref:Archaeal flagella protein FlaD/E domain-containing protein n=1 Tax=Archaeoglobus sulfaticallidus PM70-1 TaxID=387631 RepID=N0BCW2_9EURY|nr:hypothetical protein [Archaeoglobus sulfaticallidus]AGK60853.1 hypothetical protein Asulf_00845 [Archaeoglobus sulfaticallidus PM70-1]
MVEGKIDQIIADTGTDTPESRIAKLEEEVNMLKGSIKKLLIDLREIMNNLENPFQILQKLTDPLSSVQTVQGVPTPIIEEDGEKKRGKEEKKGEEDVSGEMSKLLNVEERIPKVDEEKVDEDMPKDFRIKAKQIDPISLHRLVEWTNEMVMRYGEETLIKLVEVFQMVGYISPEVKEVVVMLSSLVRDGDISDAVIDLYKLYIILNPEDTSLDSKVLKLMLDKRV